MTVHAVSSNGSKGSSSKGSSKEKSDPVNAAPTVTTSPEAMPVAEAPAAEKAKVDLKGEFAKLNAIMAEEAALENRKQEVLKTIFGEGKRGPYKLGGVLYTVWERKGRFSLSEHKAGAPVDVG